VNESDTVREKREQQVVAVISNTVYVYISVYIHNKKEGKKNLPLENIFSPSHSLVVNLHLHFPLTPHHLVSVNTFIPPVSQLGINRNEASEEMENDDDGEKPQVFHSECTSVVVMCCTQQHQLFSFFTLMVMNGVAARINRMKMSSEMCAELLNVQIMKRFFSLSFYAIEMMATR
jgi:hypothetical protein